MKNSQTTRRVDATLSRVFAIALPMTIAYASEPILGLVDTGVAGRLNDVTIVAGLAIGAVMFDLIWGTFNFLRSSVVGLTAQAFGAGDDVELDAIFLRAMVIALVGGIATIIVSPLLVQLGVWFFNAEPGLATVFSTYFLIRILSAPMSLSNYVIMGRLLGLGKSGVALFLQIVMNGTNMAFSIGLGLWLGYGIVGIAAATVIGETLAMVLGLALIVRSRGGKAWPSRTQLFDKARRRAFFQLNRDITIRSFSLIFAFAFFTRVGTSFGETTLAANAVLMHMFLLGGYLLDGFATAAEQMAGQSLGSKDRNSFRKTVQLTLVCGYIFAVTLFALYTIFGDWFIALLVPENPDVVLVARQFVFWAALTPVVGVLAFQMDGIYIGAAWGREMRDTMLFSLVIFTALAFWAQSTGDNTTLWIALNIFLALRGITMLVLLPRKMRQTLPG